MPISPEDVQQLVNALFTVSSGLERARRRIKAAGTLALLYILAAGELVTPSKIALELGVNQSTVTRQVQALQRAGYVSVTVDPDDRRSFRIALTPAGREELERLQQVGLARYARFVADWDLEDVRTLTRLLLRFEASKAEVVSRERGASAGPELGSG